MKGNETDQDDHSILEETEEELEQDRAALEQCESSGCDPASVHVTEYQMPTTAEKRIDDYLKLHHSINVSLPSAKTTFYQAKISDF